MLHLRTVKESLARAAAACEKLALKTGDALGSLKFLKLVADADRGLFSLTGTNLSVGRTLSLTAEILEAGALAVPAATFKELIAALPDGAQVTLRATATHRLIIEAGERRIELVGLDAAEFPLLDMSLPENATSISSATLHALLDQTLPAASTDDKQYNIHGVHLVARGNCLRAVATDGNRLALAQKPADASLFASGATLPHEAASYLLSMLGSGDFPIAVGMGDNRLVFTAPEIGTFFARLGEQNFPAYERVLPKAPKTFVTADRATLLQTVRGLSLLSGKTTKGMKLSASAGHVVLEMSNPELGDGKDRLPAGLEGPEVSIGLNCAYLRTALEKAPGERVVLQITGALDPFGIAPENSEEFLAVIMPMRL